MMKSGLWEWPRFTELAALGRRINIRGQTDENVYSPPLRNRLGPDCLASSDDGPLRPDDSYPSRRPDRRARSRTQRAPHHLKTDFNATLRIPTLFPPR